MNLIHLADHLPSTSHRQSKYIQCTHTIYLTNVMYSGYAGRAGHKLSLASTPPVDSCKGYGPRAAEDVAASPSNPIDRIRRYIMELRKYIHYPQEDGTGQYSSTTYCEHFLN